MVSPACFRGLTASTRWAAFQWMTLAASRLSPAVRQCWISLERSRISSWRPMRSAFLSG